MAGARGAGIAGGGEQTGAICIHHHAAELQQAELPEVLTYAGLGIKYRAAVVVFDRPSGGEKNWREHN